MNRSIFWRVFWKEYRLQRALWIAMAFLSVMATLLMFEFVVGNPDIPGPDQLAPLFWIALGLPALYLLGCGAMLFAGEHEAGTYDFQRSLPTAAWPVVAGKIAFAAVGGVAMFVPMWFLAWWPSRGELARFGGANEMIAEWTVRLPLFALQMFVWAMLFSFLTRRVLVAAALGVTIASVVVPLLALVPRGFVYNEPYFATVLWRVAIIVIVGVVDIWLGFRWFGRKREISHVAGSASASHRVATAPNSSATPTSALSFSPRTSPLRSLVWLHWRQSIRTMLVFGVLLVPVATIAIGAMVGDTRGGVPHWQFDGVDYARYGRWIGDGPPSDLTFGLAVILAMPSVPLVGLCAFMADQRQAGFHFLTDRGVRPGHVWLSRQVVVWLSSDVLVPACFLAFVVLLGIPPAALVSLAGIAEPLEFAVGYVILSLAVGQFCAMLLRSSVLAGVLCVPLTALLAAWCCLMRYLGVSWLWSALPIPVALLLATRLRTAGWLVERNDLRAWAWPMIALTAPTIAVLVTFPLYRAYEIPLVDPGFSVEQFTRPMSPGEQATLRLYQEASKKIVDVPMTTDEQEAEKAEEAEMRQRGSLGLTAWQRRGVDANGEVIAILLKASREPVASTEPAVKAMTTHLIFFARLLTWSAAKIEEEGKLDAAFDEYVAALRILALSRNCDPGPIGGFEDPFEALVCAHLRNWATRPRQTPERIIAAAREIDRLTSGLPAGDSWLKLQYFSIERFLSGDPSYINWFLSSCEVTPPLTKAWLSLPWERIRALRLLNRLTRRDLDALRCAELQAKSGEKIQHPTVFEAIPPKKPYVLGETIDLPPCQFIGLAEERRVPDYIRTTTCRRAIVLTLALEAWKLRHGSLPEKSLDELVGTCLDRLPVDPCTGKPFFYCRAGLNELSMDLIGLAGRIWERPVIPPHTPILWSPGFDATDQTGGTSGIVTGGDGRVRVPVAFSRGWAFPIP
jgi:ABC-type transport system involved in multi-copper enzyme maturation permease subunit